MIKLTNILSEMVVNQPGVKVYAQIPSGDLYKIKNFPSLPNIKNIDIKNLETVKNKNFINIINKIVGKTNHPISTINFDGNFSSPISAAYAYSAGDGNLYVVDSLNRFDERFQNEEAWQIEDWEQL
jgi:hypothetical protein